ncbi:hypothetical protein D3C86_1148850 [compost metagenome]
MDQAVLDQRDDDFPEHFTHIVLAEVGALGRAKAQQRTLNAGWAVGNDLSRDIAVLSAQREGDGIERPRRSERAHVPGHAAGQDRLLDDPADLGIQSDEVQHVGRDAAQGAEQVHRDATAGRIDADRRAVSRRIGAQGLLHLGRRAPALAQLVLRRLAELTADIIADGVGQIAPQAGLKLIDRRLDGVPARSPFQEAPRWNDRNFEVARRPRAADDRGGGVAVRHADRLNAGRISICIKGPAQLASRRVRQVGVVQRQHVAVAEGAARRLGDRGAVLGEEAAGVNLCSRRDLIAPRRVEAGPLQRRLQVGTDEGVEGVVLRGRAESAGHGVNHRAHPRGRQARRRLEDRRHGARRPLELTVHRTDRELRDVTRLQPQRIALHIAEVQDHITATVFEIGPQGQVEPVLLRVAAL